MSKGFKFGIIDNLYIKAISFEYLLYGSVNILVNILNFNKFVNGIHHIKSVIQ